MSTEGPKGRLYRYDPNGSLHVLRTDDIQWAGVESDENTFYLTEFRPSKLSMPLISALKVAVSVTVEYSLI